MSKLADTIKSTYGKKTIAEAFSGNGVANPIASSLEVLLGMKDLVSLKSRIVKSTCIYVVLPVAMKGRKGFRKLLGVTNKKMIGRCDSLYGASLSLITSAGSYLAGGEIDWKKIGLATLAGLVISPIAFYSVDIYKDVMGIEKTERKIPKFLQNATGKTKMALTAGLLMTTLSTTIPYAFTKDTSITDKFNEYKNKLVEYIHKDKNKTNPSTPKTKSL